MGNFRRLYRWAQKKTGLRKASAVLAAEKAFHDRRALGASFASANDDKEYDAAAHNMTSGDLKIH